MCETQDIATLCQYLLKVKRDDLSSEAPSPKPKKKENSIKKAKS